VYTDLIGLLEGLQGHGISIDNLYFEENMDYHVAKWNVLDEPSKIEETILAIVAAFQKRKGEAKQRHLLDNITELPLQDITVVFQNSIDAGNCKFGTERFIREHKLTNETEIKASE